MRNKDNTITTTPQFMKELNLIWEMLSIPDFAEKNNWSYKTSDETKSGKHVQDPLKYIILHHTASTVKSDQGQGSSVNTLLNNRLSVQYLIPREGEYSDHLILNLIDDDKRGRHCGPSKWSDHENLNFHSIGIEINNNGIDEKFRDEQIAVLIVLLHGLRKSYNIDPFDIISHHEIAPGRKIDPSAHFNWDLLAHYGVIYFPSLPKEKNTDKVLFNFNDAGPEIKLVKENLKKLGYGTGPTYISLDEGGNISDKLDNDTANVIRSFKRKYLPHTCLEFDEKIEKLKISIDTLKREQKKLGSENNPVDLITNEISESINKINESVHQSGCWTEHCDLLLSDILKARENYRAGQLKIEFDPKKIEADNPLKKEFQKINSRYNGLLENLGMNCFIRCIQ